MTSRKFDEDFEAVKRTPAYRRRVREAKRQARMIRLGKFILWLRRRFR